MRLVVLTLCAAALSCGKKPNPSSLEESRPAEMETALADREPAPTSRYASFAIDEATGRCFFQFDDAITPVECDKLMAARPGVSMEKLSPERLKRPSPSPVQVAKWDVVELAQNEYSIARATFAQIGTQSVLFAPARLLLSFKDGAMDGLKLLGLREKTLYSELGFKNGDTLLGANGQFVGCPSDALQLWRSLQHEERVVWDLLRRGKPVRLVLRLHGPLVDKPPAPSKKTASHLAFIRDEKLDECFLRCGTSLGKRKCKPLMRQAPELRDAPADELGVRHVPARVAESENTVMAEFFVEAIQKTGPTAYISPVRLVVLVFLHDVVGSEEDSDKLRLPTPWRDTERGREVYALQPNDLAFSLGLRNDDIIVRIGEWDVTNENYNGAIHWVAASPLKVVVLRAGEHIELTYTNPQVDEKR